MICLAKQVLSETLGVYGDNGKLHAKYYGIMGYMLGQWKRKWKL